MDVGRGELKVGFMGGCICMWCVVWRWVGVCVSVGI